MFKTIQACRALAALFVVLYHLGLAVASPRYFGVSAFGQPFISGDAGVAFFFVLSGFIITWAHFGDFGDPARLLDYLRKRAVRIYPLYWIVFLAVYATACAVPSLRATVPHDLGAVIKSLALLPRNAADAGGTGAAVLIVAWSLQYELCFYAFMGLFIVNRYVGLAASAAIIGNLATCRFEVCAFPRDFLGNHWIILFGIGAMLAVARKRDLLMPRPIAAAAACAAALIVLGSVEAVYGTAILPMDRMLAFGVFSGVALFALVQAEQHGLLRVQNRWVSLLGDSSYALYLIHFPIVSLGCKAMIFSGLHGAFGAGIAYATILVACLVSAVMLHSGLEKPILRALAVRPPVLRHTGSDTSSSQANQPDVIG